MIKDVTEKKEGEEALNSRWNAGKKPEMYNSSFDD